MFWRSVVGKLAITILLLVSFVLLILTFFLLEFFESFHIQEAEKRLEQTAKQVTLMLDERESTDLIMETIEYIKDPSSRVVIALHDGDLLKSSTTNVELADLDDKRFLQDQDIYNVLTEGNKINKQMEFPGISNDVMIVGTPVQNEDGAVFVYQSLDVIDQTKAETTKIIYLAAGIAIILTTIFAFFLSTRITSPLIKMREAAFDLTRGEFNTKVPILTHDEIGELAIAFNRMARQIKFHINALRQEKEQLASIVSSMADGVMTVNRHGKIIVINPPAEKFIEDWNFEKNIELLDNTYQLPTVIDDVLQKVIKDEKEILQEISLQGRNWVMIMTPLYDQSYIRGAVAVIRDMTEERRLDKLRKDFISNVSHELRTPISLLQGYSEAIIDDIAETKEDKNEMAQIIHEESLRMGRLVNELLDLEGMESGHIKLNLESVYIKEFASRVLNKFTRTALENNIKLKLIKKIEKEHGFFDIDRMEQVLTNLIGNAINHMDEEGQVEVVIQNTNES